MESHFEWLESDASCTDTHTPQGVAWAWNDWPWQIPRKNYSLFQKMLPNMFMNYKACEPVAILPGPAN